METATERMRSGQFGMPRERWMEGRYPERGMEGRYSMMGRNHGTPRGLRGIMFRMGSWIQSWAERGMQPFYRAGERAQEWAEQGQSTAMRMGSRMREMAEPRGRYGRYGEDRPMWRERMSSMDYPMSYPDYPESYEEMGMEGRYMMSPRYMGYRTPGIGRERQRLRWGYHGPKNYRRSDERIREDVCDRLCEGYFDARDVDVSVHDGEVTLSGSVRSREAKRLAEDIADDVGGVSQVHNQLRVREHERMGERGNGHPESEERRMHQ